VRDGQDPPVRELPWLRVCHVLLSCTSSQQAPRLQALVGFCQAFESTAPNSGPYRAQLLSLVQALRAHCTQSDPRTRAPYELQCRLLQYPLDPALWGDPPPRCRTAAVHLAARLLRELSPYAHANAASETSDDEVELEQPVGAVRAARAAQGGEAQVGGASHSPGGAERASQCGRVSHTHARAAGASRQAAALSVLGKRSIGVAIGSDCDFDVEGLGVREIVCAVGVAGVRLSSQQPTTVPTRSLRPMLDHG
jgi:hypothetical protein